MTGIILRSTPAYVTAGYGEASVLMPDMQIVTAGQSLTVANHRTIYTDQYGADIIYTFPDKKKSVPTTVHIPNNGNLEFLASAEITVKRGRLLLPGASESEHVAMDTSTLIGYPILPSMRFAFARPTAHLSIGYFDGSTMDVTDAATYRMEDLGARAASYSASLTLPNGFYYGKLHSFAVGGAGTSTDIALLAPQQAGDTDAPLVTFPRTLSIPIFTERTIDLRPYIADASAIRDVYVDGDTTVDSTDSRVPNSNDAIPDNDDDTATPDNPYGIHKGAHMTELVFGPYDSVFTRHIRIFFKDVNNNISYRDVTLSTYAPVPELSAVTSSGVLAGIVTGKQAGVPVDIFRARGAQIDRVIPSSLPSDSGGVFSYTSGTTDSGVVLSREGQTYATVDERTGRIHLEAAGYTIAFSGATASDHMQLSIHDSADTPVFREIFYLPPSTSIQATESLESAQGNGVFVDTPDDTVTFVRNSATAASLPNGGFLTDSTHRALVGISAQGEIHVLDSHVSVRYDTYGTYILLRIERAGRSIANILYRIDKDYAIQ